jgi:hypothetical protein
MLIDCDTCAGRFVHCQDCVINVLLSRPPERLELDDSERGAIANLADAGLVPPLRMVPVLRTGSAVPGSPAIDRTASSTANQGIAETG